MKFLNILIAFSLIIVFSSCEKDFTNKNQVTNDAIYSTSGGIKGAAIGMTEHFVTSTYSKIVEVPGITTREIGITSTFATPEELAKGGATLPDENTGISALWSRLLRDKAVAEEILANIDDVETMAAEERAGVKAYAKFFKAMTLGYLVQNFKEVPVDKATDGNATFGNRTAVLNECISLLNSASADIASVEGSADFVNGLVSTDFSIEDILNAFNARYNLFAGNWQAAIDAADLVDLTAKSVWIYDGVTHKNPIYQFAVFDGPDTHPTDNFGLVGDLIPDIGDGRIGFFLNPVDSFGTEETGAWPIEFLLGFATSETDPLPVYLPGEMLLVKAEAYANMSQFPLAVDNINAVRNKTDDIFGVNAGLEDWTGDANSKADILDEVYRNRCIELFFSGMRLEDSRRIHDDFVPSQEADTHSERNRNYYPYPFEERTNNDNCPDNPLI